MTFRGGTAHLVYAFVGFALLALAWNALALRFGDRSIQRRGDVFDRAAHDLRRTAAELPPPEHPRVVFYGSSQFATVRGEPDGGVHTTAHRVYEDLTRRGLGVEVVDFSDSGQQVIESLVIHFATRDRTRPSAIVIGLNLFSMLQIEVRPTLVEPIDVATVRGEIRSVLPPDANPRVVDALFEWSKQTAQRVNRRGKTIQQRADERIGSWLTDHVAAFANRQVMFDEWIDLPLRRDIASAVVRWLRNAPAATQTAQSYAIGPAYPTSLLALEAIARDAQRARVPLLVVGLPFDDQRPPVPFDAAIESHVRADLTGVAQRTGSQLVDLSHALASEHFGYYEDGSPDNLHFDAAGHAAVGAPIAAALAPVLAASRATTSR